MKGKTLDSEEGSETHFQFLGMKMDMMMFIALSDAKKYKHQNWRNGAQLIWKPKNRFFTADNMSLIDLPTENMTEKEWWKRSKNLKNHMIPF